jgi:hypothetical protein
MATKKSKRTKRQYVVVRTYSAGVHVGEMVSRKGKEVVLANAKRIWRWFGANTLNEIALRGVLPTSKISDAVESITLTEAIEIIPCAPAAESCLRGATWAK